MDHMDNVLTAIAAALAVDPNWVKWEPNLGIHIVIPNTEVSRLVRAVEEQEEAHGVG